jgi:hypothetical protein
VGSGTTFKVFVKDQSFPGIGRVMIGEVPNETKLIGKIIEVHPDKSFGGVDSYFVIEVSPSQIDHLFR